MKTKFNTYKLAALCAAAFLLVSGCATTQYGRLEVSKLTDSQLSEELVSIDQGLGIQAEYRNVFGAIDTSPRLVVTSASTTYSGNFNAQYNNANKTLYGSFNGNGYTTYQSMDMNGGARFGQALALIINASKTAKLENRRNAVLSEVSHRRGIRENNERVTGQFLLAHPDIAANRDLLIACLEITRHRTLDTLEQLQQAAEIMRTLPKNRWVGWVEAHGDSQYPSGVEVASYFMDTVWDRDTLTGKGKASDGSEMTLTAKRNQAGTIEGIVQSHTMEAKFIGRMTDIALCLDYTGTESGHPIRGITWAFRGIEMNDSQRGLVPTAQTQNGSFAGRYVGSGKSVSNGVSDPYQITLDVFDSGEITFACMALVNNQQVVVKGKGTVDSDRNVIVQNEFGASGRGTISGKVLEAGGQNADGSIQSYFTAQKQ